MTGSPAVAVGRAADPMRASPGGGRGRGVLATVALGLTCEAAYALVGQLSLHRPRPDPTLPIDGAIPLVPHAVWAYVAWVPFLLLPALVPHDLRRLQRTLVAAFLACFAGYVAFLLVPLDLPRPAPGDGVAGRVLAAVYAVDRPHGGGYCPSLHVATVSIAAAGLLGRSRSLPVALAVVLGAVAIAASTVLTKQHVLLDVVVAVPWAIGAWHAAGRVVSDLRPDGAAAGDGWGRVIGFAARVAVGVIVVAILAPAAAWTVAGRLVGPSAEPARFLGGPWWGWSPLALLGVAALARAARRRSAHAAGVGLVAWFAAAAVADGEWPRAVVGAPIYAGLLVLLRRVAGRRRAGAG